MILHEINGTLHFLIAVTIFFKMYYFPCSLNRKIMQFCLANILIICSIMNFWSHIFLLGAKSQILMGLIHAAFGVVFFSMFTKDFIKALASK